MHSASPLSTIAGWESSREAEVGLISWVEYGFESPSLRKLHWVLNMSISEKFVPNDTLVKWRGIFLYIWGRFIWSLGKFRPKKFNLCTFLQIGAKRAGCHDGAAAQAQAHEGTNRLVFDLHRTLSWGFFLCLRIVPSLPPAAQAPRGSSGAVAIWDRLTLQDSWNDL